MIYPKFLSTGQTIGVPAPSSGAYDQQHVNKLKNAKEKMQQAGFEIIMSNNVFKSEKARSASAIERAQEFEQMYTDPNIDFLICAAGGEFLVECLSFIDFDKITKNPKLVQGFSDPTGILFTLTTKYDIATIYGSNFSGYGMQQWYQNLMDNLQIIQGNIVEQKSFEYYDDGTTEKVTGLEGYSLTVLNQWKMVDNKKENDSEKLHDNKETDDNKKTVYNEKLKAEFSGRIIGGCIDIITELAGTKYDGVQGFVEKYKDDGIVWYFDNCELSKEELIRTLWKFNELGYFKNTNGIIFGRNGIEKSYLGYDMLTAMKDSVLANLKVPIIYDADISHIDPSMTIINGAIATISYENGKGSIAQELR